MANQTDKATIDLVINGQQSQTSLKDITTAAVNARKALSQMAETDPGYAKQKRELESLMAAQQQRIVRINQEKSAWQSFKTSAASVTAGVTGASVISAGIGLIGAGIRGAIADVREFDAASKELSAVTGATGADLEYLNKQALNSGPAFGKSGAEMLEAYKLMASAKPELLAQKELLVETTKAAVTLSQAGKISLEEATKVTAESLNQFGEGADQANRYINVIAAGAKEGSAEINEMGGALKNAGTVAKAQGLSFEQTNAVLQSMSTIALKGGEAGTGLRNVLLALGTGSDDTNPKVVGLQKALENLEKKNLSAKEMLKLFGKENITAAQHIITHRKEIGGLTDKITGTNEAFSQAEKNNASLDAQMARFWATMAKLGVIIGTAVMPAINALVGGATTLANFLSNSLTPASEKATDAFNDQRAKVQDLTKNFSPLLDRHDALKKKTVLTKDEQNELKRIVAQVAETVPGAITQFDAYGNAMAVSTDKAREFIKMQQLLLQDKNQDAIRTQTDALAKEQKQLKENAEYRKNATSGKWDVIQMTGEELKEFDAQNRALQESVAKRQLLLKGLTGDYMSNKPSSPAAPAKTATPPPIGNTDNGETKEDKKARLAKERKHKSDVKTAEKANEDLDRLMGDARERTAKADDDLFTKEQLQFGDHYAAMFKLAAGNKTKTEEITKLMYDELSAIQDKENERQQKASEKRYEEKKKEQEAELKASLEHLKSIRDTEQAKIENKTAHGLSKEDGKLQEQLIEQQYLLAQELIYSQHYETLRELAGTNADQLEAIDQAALTTQEGIEADHTKLTADQAQARIDIRDKEFEHQKVLAEQQQQLLMGLSALLQNDWTATVQGFRDHWKQMTLVQKAALVATKAYAIAEIGVNLARQISADLTGAAIWDTFVPGAGFLYGLKHIAADTAKAALQVAAVAGISFSTPAFEDGGFTSTDQQPSGYTSGPTYFKKRNFIAGEKGQEWIMSGPMLQNPVMANLAGALQALQVTGQWRNLSFSNGSAGGAGGGSSASTGNGDALLMMMIQEQQQTRIALQQQASRPINYNYFKVRDTAERVDYINTVVNL